MKNSTQMMATESGTTYGSASGVTICSPSVAPRIEMAGVMTPSP